MKIKTSELTGAALDWAVAKCESKIEIGVYGTPELHEGKLHLRYCDAFLQAAYTPSTYWEQGGPIIEREWIDMHCVNDSLWEAECPANCGLAMQNGPTPLTAAMRCYVASKMGDEIDIPQELI